MNAEFEDNRQAHAPVAINTPETLLTSAALAATTSTTAEETAIDPIRNHSHDRLHHPNHHGLPEIKGCVSSQASK